MDSALALASLVRSVPTSLPELEAALRRAGLDPALAAVVATRPVQRLELLDNLTAAVTMVMLGRPLKYDCYPLAVWLLQRQQNPFREYWLVQVTQGLELGQPLQQLLTLQPELAAQLEAKISLAEFVAPAAPIYRLPAGWSPPTHWLPLTELMCSRLKDNLGCLEAPRCCSELGSKISSAMVRVAATRIFADPTQSIMEILVNSVDSYRRLRDPHATSIGKFGMGFFSFLYWVVARPTTELGIVTWVSSKEESPGHSTWVSSKGWRVLFRQDAAGRLEVQLTAATTQPPQGHGTSVSLRDRTGGLPAVEFAKQARRLRFLRDVSISGVSSRPGTPSVGMNLMPSSVVVQDFAEGMSLETLMGSLLVPSVSTKTLQTAPTLESLRWQVDQESELLPGDNSFIITVGDVVVVEIPGATQQSPAQTSNSSSLGWRLSLPISTPLPVSRDDILLAPGSPTHRLFQDGLWALLEKTIHSQPGQVDALIELLYRYAHYSGQRVASEGLERSLEELTKLQNVVMLPDRRLVELVNAVPDMPYLGIYYPKAPLIQAIEAFSKLVPSDSPYRRFFQGQLVVPLATPAPFSPFDGGLPSLIFAPPSMSRQQIGLGFGGAIVRAYEDTLPAIPSPFSNPRLAVSVPTYPNAIFTKRPGVPPELWQALFSPASELSKWIVNLYLALEAKLSSFHPEKVRLLLDRINLEIWPLDGKRVTLPQLYLRLRGQSQGHIFTYTAGISHSHPQFNLEGPLQAVFLNCLTAAAAYGLQELEPLLAAMTATISRLTLQVGYGAQTAIVWGLALADPHQRYGTLEAAYPSYQQFFLPPDEPELQRKLRDSHLKSIQDNLTSEGYPVNNQFWLLDMRHFPQPHMAALLTEVDILRPAPEHYQACWRVLRQMRTGFEGSRMFIVLSAVLLRLGLKTPEGLLRLLEQPVLDYAFAEMRHRFSPEFFAHWEADRPKGYTSEYIDKYQNSFFTPLSRAVELFVEGRHHRPVTVGGSLDLELAPRRIASFTANQLLDYVFRTPTIELALPENFLPQVQAHPGRSGLQSIQIAVNEGTSKPFVDSVLTELVQNSVDAIRQAQAGGDVYLGVNQIDVSHHAGRLSVRDYVGIASQAWLYLLVPFLSTKSTADLLTTGEMGTGFFNVYRQPWVREVSIYSGRYHLRAVPVVSQGRVVDLQYEFSRLAGTYQGTLVEMLLRPLSSADHIRLQIDVLQFVRLQLSVLNVPVLLNGRPVAIDKRLIYETPVGRVYSLEGSQAGMPSLVMTNGIPMGTLTNYLMGAFDCSWDQVNSRLAIGVVVDLNKGYYRPVQSRNRVVATPELKQFLLDACFYWLCEALLHLSSDDASSEIENYLPAMPNPNSMDGGSVGQFANYNGGPAVLVGAVNFASFESSSMMPVSLADIISQICRNYILLPGTKLNQDTFEPMLSIYRLPAQSPMLGLIRRWFSNKKGYTGPIATAFTASHISDNVAQNRLEALEGILRRFVELFYRVGSRLDFGPGVHFRHTPPVVKIAAVGDEGVAGFYSTLEHKIILSAKFLEFRVHGFLQAWEQLRRHHTHSPLRGLQYLRTSAELGILIGNINPAALLIHELQHSLLGQDENAHAAHDPRPFIYQGQTRVLTYDQGCQLVYSAIIEAGLLELLLSD